MAKLKDLIIQKLISSLASYDFFAIYEVFKKQLVWKNTTTYFVRNGTTIKQSDYSFGSLGLTGGTDGTPTTFTNLTLTVGTNRAWGGRVPSGHTLFSRVS